MNNLKPTRIQSIPTDIDGRILHINNSDEDRKIFYLKDGLLYFKWGQKNDILLNPQEHIIRVEFMYGQDKISLVTLTKLTIIDCVSLESHITTFEEDVVDICWNNTYDYFVVLFANNVVKTYVFTPGLECLLHGIGNLLATVPELETVGWGSESTQFQIDRSTQDKNEKVDECNHIQPTDDGKPSICWADDKSEFVVSFVIEDVRKFMVFDHLCLPKTVSKLPEGQVYGSVAWKPRGNIIAAAVYHNQKNCVVFFEQNGLIRHILPLEQLTFPVISLSWSPCGSVLMVIQEDETKQRHISLYAASNYRWYLKQHLIFNELNHLYNASWLITSPKCLELLVITKKQLIQYKYKFEFQRDHSRKTIATIDGMNILFYNFMESVNPPPTCWASVKIANPVNIIEFHGNVDMLAAIDDSNFIYILSTKTNVEITSKTFLYEPIFPLNINHLFWKMENPNVIIDNNTPNFSVSLYEFDTVQKRLLVKQDLGLTSNDTEDIVCVDEIIIVHGGNKRRVYCGDNIPIASHFAIEPLQVIPFILEEQIFCFTLTTDQELYLETNFLMKGVTSMMMFSHYLLFTDDSTLYTVELNLSNITQLPHSGVDLCHKRPLNEIMYLVGMAGNDTSTILYTPRGTLDVISSLPLEINYIKEKIASDKWAEVIYFMRLFKMNWNLLIDLNPHKFYANFKEIITICHRRGVLNSVIDEITNQNNGNTKNSVAVIPHMELNKKHEFFNELENLFDQNGAYCQYFPTVMKICLDQSNLKKAMFYASNLLKVSERLLVKAIKLLKIRVEAMDLFNAALQIFDLNLAAFVATQCQINPQEVDPLLDELRNLNELNRRIAIHLRFQNWEDALPYMLRSNMYSKDQILSHIEAHDVSKRAYREAVTLELPYLDEIILLYIEKLARAKLYREGAVLCVQHRMYEEALELFKYALDYRKCIEYLTLSTRSAESKKEFYKELAQRLVAGNRLFEAALIYEEHLDDPTSAVNVLIDGNKFTAALRIARLHKLRELIVTTVIPMLFRRLGIISGSFDENLAKFTRSLARLKEIRFRKKLRASQVTLTNVGLSISLDNGIHNRLPQPDVDMESVITSGSSVSSSASSSSRKMMRKLEKQKQDTTENSRFEDIALIREIHIVLTTTFQYGPELREIFMTLVEISLVRMRLMQVYHNKFFRTQEQMIEEAKIIWNDEFKIDSPCKHVSENISYLDEKYRTPPPEMNYPGTSWSLEILKD